MTDPRRRTSADKYLGHLFLPYLRLVCSRLPDLAQSRENGASGPRSRAFSKCFFRKIWCIKIMVQVKFRKTFFGPVTRLRSPDENDLPAVTEQCDQHGRIRAYWGILVSTGRRKIAVGTQNWAHFGFFTFYVVKFNKKYF